MQKSGLISVKQVVQGGFYYDNLKKMAQFCREETDSDKLVVSYILCGIFSHLADVVAANPYKKTIEDLESKYKSIISSLLEKVIPGSPSEDQLKILTKLIRLNWNV